MTSALQAGCEIFVFLLTFLSGEDLHRVLAPCRRCIGVCDSDVKDRSDATLPEVLDGDVASEVGGEVISCSGVSTGVDGGFVGDSAWGECHTAEVAPFGRDIVVMQRDKATALAGQGMFNGEPLVTPVTSRRQVLGVETHAKA